MMLKILLWAAMLAFSQQITWVVTDLNKPKPSEDTKVVDYLTKNMPEYFYYSNYDNFDFHIYLPGVLDNIGKKDFGVREAAKARTLKTLFRFVKLDPKEVTELMTLCPNKGLQKLLQDFCPAQRK